VGPWREGPSSTTGQGETHHDWPRHFCFECQYNSMKWVLPPNTNVEHKYSLSTIVPEEMRWVHGGKGQVSWQDRVKSIITGPDAHGVFTANIVQEICATTQHQCGTQYCLSIIVTNKLKWVYGGKVQVAWHDRVTTTMTGPDTGFLQPIKFQVMGATTQHQCGTQI
jgi:hypothetical protein